MRRDARQRRHRRDRLPSRSSGPGPPSPRPPDAARTGATGRCRAGGRRRDRAGVAGRAVHRHGCRGAAAGPALPGVSFLPALRRSNVHGALDFGLSPGLLPGRVGLEDGRQWYEHHWGAPLPATAGLDALGMLARAAAGQLDVLFLLGCRSFVGLPGQSAGSAGPGRRRLRHRHRRLPHGERRPGGRRAPGGHVHRTTWHLHQPGRPRQLARAKSDSARRRPGRTG